MKKLLLAFCVLGAVLGNAQTWTYYDPANTSIQLPSGNVFSIKEDLDGSMWFATRHGVSNFNGVSWKNYFKKDGLADNYVKDIIIDSLRNKWFISGATNGPNGTTSFGVSKFDGKVWTIYNETNGLASNKVNCMAIDLDGIIWFGTAGGVSRFDGKTWATFNDSNELNGSEPITILIDKKGNKWFGTYNGVSRFDGKSWTSYLDTNSVYKMVVDFDDVIWFATNNGVFRFDGNNWTKYDTSNGLGNNIINDIAIDSNGIKWFGTSFGVSRFDDSTWTTFNESNGLISNHVTIIGIDNKGNKWIGTSLGVSKYDDKTWINFNIKNGLKNWLVRSITFDKKGNKWFSTSDYYSYESFNVSKYNDTSWTHYTKKGGMNSNKYYGEQLASIYSVLIDKKQNKWFAGARGITKYNDTIWTTKYDDTTWAIKNSAVDSTWISTSVACQTIDSEGNIWVGTYNGIFKFDGIKWTKYSDALGIPLQYIDNIIFDLKGQMWLSTTYDGIFKFDGNTWTRYNKNYGRVLGIDVLGNIWFTYYGYILYKFDGIAWKYYNFPEKSLYQFASDNKGNSWFAGNALYKFDGNSFIDFSKIINFNSFSRIKSLVVDEMNNLWMYYDYLAKFDGVNCYKYLFPSFGSGSIAIDNKGNKWIANDYNVFVFSDGGAGPLMFSKIQKGYVFYDLNSNGKKDLNESNIAGQIVKIDNNYTNTQNNGLFYTSLNNGTHTFTYRPQANWKLTTDSSITVTVTDAPIRDTLNFGVQAIANKHEVETKLTGIATRAGFESKSCINYANRGTLAENGTVSYTLADEASLVQSIPVADSAIGKRLVWKYNNLIPNEQRQISIITQMPGVNYLGDTLVSIAKIKSDFSAFSDTLKQVLTGSYDPNDKLVAQGIGSKGYVLFGKELEYTVRFQNTGTDTAFNVNIRDTLDLNLDVASLQIVASSHPVKLDLRGQNEATFRFENILLPDSNVNQLGSNGFVKYTIKPKKNLPENTPVKNKAHIYFDFNPAIITNETVNTYVSKLPSVVTGIQGYQSNKSATVFPNPTKDEFTIVFPQSGTYEISLANIQGKTIKTWNESVGQETTLSVEDVEPGMYLYTAQSRNGQRYMGKLVIGK